MKTPGKLITTLCIAIALPLNSLAAAPVFNLQFTLTNEDFGGSVKDTYKSVTGSARSMLGITRNSAFNLNADLYTRSYNNFDQWDNDGLLLEAIYSFIPTAGFRKPDYLIGLRHELESFDEPGRDFNRASNFLAASLRLDDSISMTSGIQYSKKSTDEEDDHITSVFLNTDKRLNEKRLTYLNLKYEAESGVTSPNWPSSANGANINTDSNNKILAIATNYSIDSHHSIDVSYLRQNYSISDSADVTSEVISLDYFYKL